MQIIKLMNYMKQIIQLRKMYLFMIMPQRRVYPYNFAIVNQQNIKLVASTANPFAAATQYNIELDTTEFFNSPLKITKTVNSIGRCLNLRRQ